ncbi:MAG: UDP-N-acetylmuramate dehydrogenase [Synergistaceae bacterium]|jgi:UDP-N-acetylmuramate dehydrogenase|nr:UDP-N-acetylmuramate dehydrogenase [Synergistaceae bacterium]
MWKTDLKKELACCPEEKKELAPLSTLGVGGWAELFVEPTELQDVLLLFQRWNEKKFPLYILGGGTNVAFADGKIAGVVLSTRQLSGCRWKAGGDEAELEVEAGYSLSRVVFLTTQEGFTGAEFAQGIPGTVGGAVAGNAGAGGKGMGDLLKEITTVESDGSLHKWKREEFECSYRYCSLTEYFPTIRCFVSCKMKFGRASYGEIEKNLQTFRQARSKQPQGARSAGCAFKNPAGDSAGRLLDICGCKGLTIGGAAISEKHANFLLNRGNATGADIFRLMELCRDIVFRKIGVCLEPEIKLLGFEG